MKIYALWSGIEWNIPTPPGIAWGDHNQYVS